MVILVLARFQKLLNNTRMKLVDETNEYTPLLSTSERALGSGNKYTSSSSNFSSIPSQGVDRQKYRFSSSNGFTDESTTI